MTAPQVALQITAAADLLAAQSVKDLVATSDLGRAVFAVGQDFPDVYPRLTLETPQWLPGARTCGRSGDLILTLHSWTRGPDHTLTSSSLADAASIVLGRRLPLAGWRVSSWEDEGSNPVGDPNPGIGHVVTRLRYSVQQTA